MKEFSVMNNSRADKGKCLDNVDAPGFNRRKFVKGAATVMATAATIPLGPLVENSSTASAADGNSSSAMRVNDCFNYRVSMARAERIHVGSQPDNGDIARFTDFSGNYSKALLHDGLGVPNAAAYASLRTALATGNAAD